MILSYACCVEKFHEFKVSLKRGFDGMREYRSRDISWKLA